METEVTPDSKTTEPNAEAQPDTTATKVEPAKPTEPASENNAGKVTDWEKEAKKWESRSKENYEYVERWKEYEEKVKPEQEKTASKLTAALAELDELKTNILKNEIALEMNLPKEAISHLQGSTAEELRADAASKLSLFGGSPAPVVNQKPAVQPNKAQGPLTDSSKPLKVSTPEEYLALLRSKA
jgi:hypothetical protein